MLDTIGVWSIVWFIFKLLTAACIVCLILAAVFSVPRILRLTGRVGDQLRAKDQALANKISDRLKPKTIRGWFYLAAGLLVWTSFAVLYLSSH